MRLKLLAVPLVAAVALLAGCTPGTPVSVGASDEASNGVENLSADEIVAKAHDALVGASSFRVSGVFGSGMFAATADLTYTDDDSTGTGTFLGVGVKLLKKDATLYANADPSFFSQFVPADQQGVLVTIANTWVMVPASWVTILVPVPLTADAAADYIAPKAPYTKGDTGELSGTPIVKVTDANGTVYSVATVGEPYIVKVEYSGGTGLSLSSFDEPVTIEAPANAKNLLELLGISNG